MANALTCKNKNLSAGANSVTKRFSCLLSGNYAQGGAIGVPGETLAFNSATIVGKPSRPRLPGPSPAGATPAASDFNVIGFPAGYSAIIEQNTGATPSPQNMVLRVFQAGSGNAAPVELATGAYPAVLTAEAFTIEVRVPSKYN